MFKGYVRANKRKILAESGITLDRAIDFLSEVKDSLIIDEDGREYTQKEELEYVKSLRSLPGIGESEPVISGGSVYEDPNRELFESARDNTKPSTECDN